MKKVFALLIALVLTATFTCYAEPLVDFSAYSDEELTTIKDQLDAEIASRTAAGIKPWKTYGAGALLPDPVEVFAHAVKEDATSGFNSDRGFSTWLIGISQEELVLYVNAMLKMGYTQTRELVGLQYELENQEANATVLLTLNENILMVQMHIYR